MDLEENCDIFDINTWSDEAVAEVLANLDEMVTDTETTAFCKVPPAGVIKNSVHEACSLTSKAKESPRNHVSKADVKGWKEAIMDIELQIALKNEELKVILNELDSRIQQLESLR
jgi:hypothetical protein